MSMSSFPFPPMKIKYFKNPQFSLVKMGRNKDYFETHTIGISAKVFQNPKFSLAEIGRNKDDFET